MQNKIKFSVYVGAFIIALISLPYTNGFSKPNIRSEVPLVVVNGDTISSNNIDKMIVKTHKTLDMSNKKTFDYDKLLVKSINDLLILQEAYALGLDENEAILALLKERRSEVVQKLYFSNTFKPDINVTDNEIMNYCNENLVSYQFRTISLATIEEANEVYELLKQGHSFDNLATEKSLDPYKLKQGLHETTFKMNVDESLLKASENLEIGDYSKPVKYLKYFSILSLNDIKAASEMTFEAFKDKIRERLTEQGKENAWYDFMAVLLKKYPISSDSSIIQEIIANKESVLKKEFREGTDKPVLKIDNNTFITDNQLRTEISHGLMGAGTTPFETILVSSINKKQEELLGRHSAIQNGYWDSTRVVNWYYKELDSCLIELYLKEMVVSKIKFNSDEFKEYYNNNLESYIKPDQYMLDQMVIADHDISHEASTALKDGAQWSYIFNKFNATIAKSSDNNQWISIENYPEEVVDELKAMSVGQTTNSFQSSEGFIIFKIKDRKSGGYKSIDEVDMTIREVMFQKKFNEILDGHLEKLKQSSKIDYIQNNIDNYFGTK